MGPQMNSIKRLVVALTALAIWISPALAQGKGRAAKAPESDQKTQESKKKSAEIEKAYQDAMKKIPDQKPADPWATMR